VQETRLALFRHRSAGASEEITVEMHTPLRCFIIIISRIAFVYIFALFE
jgi:hypothetical protein